MSDVAVEPARGQRPSISDVALEAGVSRAAVSKVIRDAYGVSPAMRTRVEAAIDKLGYRPRVAARSMRGASFTIGFEIPEVGNDFFAQVVDGAAASLADSKYQLIIAPSLGNLSGSSVLDALVDRQVDGIIAISSDVTGDWLEQLGRQVPTVLIGRHESSEHYDTITGDDRTGADLVMEHLLGLGHRRIAHVTVRPRADREPHAVRLEAYRAWMQDAGLEPLVEYVQSSEESACEATRGLLEAGDAPTAVFAGHDTLAIGALRAVSDLGLGARDVSVVGYDNIPLAHHPLISLTTVDQFGPQFGVTAIELLMQRIRDGRSTARHPQLRPELRIRRSTQPLSDGSFAGSG